MVRAVAILVLCVLVAAPTAAMDARVRSVDAGTDVVVAAVEVSDVVPRSFVRVVDEGNTLYMRLQAELWENRPTWDRLVYPALVRAFRIVKRGTPAELVVADEAGAEQRAASGSFATTLTLGKSDRIAASGKYYVRLVATVGTVADRDIDRFNDAVFGRESDGGSAVAFGRFLMRSVLQLSDYLESVSAEAKGRAVSGRELLHR